MLGVVACGGKPALEVAEPEVQVQEPATTSATTTELTEAEKQRDYLLSLILFWDNFQDGNTNGWIVNSGWEVQQDGDIYNFQSAMDGAAYLPFGVDWTDYVYRAVVKVDEGGVSLNYLLSSEGRYAIFYHESGLYLVKDAPLGEVTVLAQTTQPALGEWHWFTIAMQGAHIQVYVDKVLALDYTDPDPLTAGTAGLGAVDGPAVSVDDVLIHKRVKGLPTAPAGFSQITDPAETGAITNVISGLSEGVDVPVAADVAESSGQAPAIEPGIIGGDKVIAANGVEGENVTVELGEPVVVSWDVGLVSEAYIDDEPVPSVGSFVITPEQDTTLVLEAVDISGESYSLPLTIDLP